MTLRPNRNQDDVEREKTHRKTDRREEEEKQYTTNEREIETNSHQIAIRRRTRCYYHYEAYHIVKCCKVGKKVVAPLIYSFSYTHTHKHIHIDTQRASIQHRTDSMLSVVHFPLSNSFTLYSCAFECVCVCVCLLLFISFALESL